MFDFQLTKQNSFREVINNHYQLPEKDLIFKLIEEAEFNQEAENNIIQLSSSLIQKVRDAKDHQKGVQALMHEFSLSSMEGVALMCLAESFLRIPDSYTRNLLIQDKLSDNKWQEHINNSPSLFVNASAYGLLITGKLVSTNEKNLLNTLKSLFVKLGFPFIRTSVGIAVKILANQFISGETIEKALENIKENEVKGFLFSFDMLGEAAFTFNDANKYFEDYKKSIIAVGKNSTSKVIKENNGVSIKLSALHPKYLRSNKNNVFNQLLPKVKELFLLAKQFNISLNIDAEEAARLDLSLDLLTILMKDEELAGFDGIGFVVQSYSKRAFFVLDYLIDLARETNHKIMIRLVKGAYWDSEIKIAQQEGQRDYPVWTRKIYTDVNYIACAKKLLKNNDVVFPQFASHNAYTIATIYELGKGYDYEFQCLFGMGESLHNNVIGDKNLGINVRVYAPVGTYETLLAYLVRRLLENGANSSFVNQIADDNISISSLTVNPIKLAKSLEGVSHTQIPNPINIFSNRLNSKGFNLSNENDLIYINSQLNNLNKSKFIAKNLASISIKESVQEVFAPFDLTLKIGDVYFADLELNVDDLVQKSLNSNFLTFSQEERKRLSLKFADLLEENKEVLYYLLIKEAGKTLQNAIDEVREAVDFSRFYAVNLPENDNFKGCFVTISPWNFPAAIFIGQIIACLNAGSVVIAKPAEQTSLIAYEIIKLMYKAGFPKDSIQLILGDGIIGSKLVQNPQISGVLFTGSTSVAKLINKTLAQREDNPILIAETGGQNALVIDSSALPEQVCQDVLKSAFDSAGQRCSALRIIAVQKEVSEKIQEIIVGAMKELNIGSPLSLATEIACVIDGEAQRNLESHLNKMKNQIIYQSKLDLDKKGYFIPPTLIKLNDLKELDNEVFGPILHFVEFEKDKLDDFISQLNLKGFALTFGIHSRIDSSCYKLIDKINAGNIYVNRNIVGAVVGVQPFGGFNNSGTGPKAGGYFYLPKLMKKEFYTLKNTGLINESSINNFIDKHQEYKEDLQKGKEFAISHSLNGLQEEFKSITGEKNYIQYKKIDRVFIYGGLESQTVKLMGALIALDIKPINLTFDLFGETKSSFEDVKSHDKVICLSKLSSDIKMKLADLEGSIVQLIEGENLNALYHEQSISINTTSAGGNASLMTAQED